MPFAQHSAVASVRLPVTAAEIREDLRRPDLPSAVRYALIRRPTIGSEKPVAYPSLPELARAIHRARRGRALQLVNTSLQLRSEAEARDGVSVWTLTDDGHRGDYLGWAWLGGADSRALQAALFAVQPIAAEG